MAWFFLPLFSFFAAKLFHNLVPTVELGEHLLQLSTNSSLVTASYDQNAIQRPDAIRITNFRIPLREWWITELTPLVGVLHAVPE